MPRCPTSLTCSHSESWQALQRSRARCSRPAMAPTTSPYEDIYASGAVEDHPYRRIIGDLRTLYRKDDLAACLPLGTLDPRALPCESYKLAFTPGLLNGVYQGSLAGQPAQALSPAPSTVVEGTGESGGGYVDLDANGDLWIRSGQVRYSPGASDSAA